ncbi:membrane-bound PQQ-dependent dehydrogenase, glucose/quinate/shikimate family [Pseudorhodoferax sp. Leaf267]|uniref:membrane-bound PQQ-dependent dehydrogenase, glucose/quinate/shikimate family n=1 Tax=Pseudorhodoferax sp. Leaf267 TaxID=1736316 RepID=UPI0006F8BE06|nr:membrane-bound PQQ-dependent dehydrogenase, glucose/quinate/shikimate family [Pseudorhodoferax sp. Leaf267]KQP17805.1 glucose dehydrogenase [Pseudorhodoferax sp. Leaf267]
MPPNDRPRFIVCMAALLCLCGAFLAGGGAWLLALGGSPYYLAAGGALLLAGVLLWRRSGTALTVFAALFALSLVWSLWEAGLDWWPLAARMGVLFILGVLLRTRWITRALRPEPDNRWARRPVGGLLLSLGLTAFVAVAIASWAQDPHQRQGDLPGARGAVAADAAGLRGMPAGEWHAYGRTGDGQRYSPLDQITPANVADLQLAWQFRTGDLRGQPGDPEETTYEVTPLKIGKNLYMCNPHQTVMALDATTGAEVWRHDPKVQGSLALQHLTCRGLSYQPPDPAAPVAAGPGACPAGKLFMPTADGRLLALNPVDGRPCTAFGAARGHIDLWANMPNHRPGAYYSTSPVVVTHKLVIVGGTVLDNASVREQSGVIRAFDIETGALVWNWDSGNPDSTAPIARGQRYTPNSPNSWSISSVDETLGMVYVPMGNQPPDQWGGNRSPAVEKYSSSVVALDLASGQVRWVFQTVHHDLWDYDVPSQPSLIDLTIDGATVPALVQPTKQGELFVLDRRTGTPIHPVTEVPAPQGAAAGDRTAPTQPKTALSFEPARLTGRSMWGATLFDQMACRIAFHRLRYEGRFTPPSVQGSLIHPGNFGVFNWGSVAVDPVRQIAFTTPTYLAFVSTLVPRPDDRTLMVQDGGPPEGALPALNENFGAPYAARMGPFLSPVGLPCTAPPWGYVAGADLQRGTVAWQHRNGTVRDLAPVPLPFRMGVPTLGGPMLTAGGVAFLSGTLDNYVRGYDVTSGRELWRERLPAGGQATPMTYLGEDGRQYLLVVAGGHGSTGTKAGDSVIAYALPRR